MNELNYLSPENGEFYELETGLIAYRDKETDYGRVAVLRMFPLEYKDEFLSVRTENYERRDKNNEIGIIRKLSAFNALQQEIVLRELSAAFSPYFAVELLLSFAIQQATWFSPLVACRSQKSNQGFPPISSESF